jgi:hypothetical protein
MSVQDSAVFRLTRMPGIREDASLLESSEGMLPTFVVRHERRSSRVWGSLKTLLSSSKFSGPVVANGMLQKARLRRLYFRGPAFSWSFLLHCAAIALIAYMPLLFPAELPRTAVTDAMPERIYYIPVQPKPRPLPRITPAGEGARPMNGSAPGVPAKGSTVQSPITVASNPARPDNNRQTIIQPNSPPELHITADMKLPNMILVKPLDVPKLQFNPSASRPSPIDRKISPDAPPSPAPVNPAVPMVTIVAPTKEPQLLMPVPAASGIASRANSDNRSSGDAPTVTVAGDGSSVLVLVVDPADPGSKVTLPPGNRSGEFSVSPGAGAGSPGGSEAGVASAGSKGHGTGGDTSVGIGSGASGGGGGKTGSSVAIFTSGGEPSGSLGSELALKMVYPVPAALLAKLRRNSLIISTGPNGGGGLDVYGAMHCGKIYTIFLPMPGKNWTMQYCRPPDAAPEQAVQTNSTVVRLGEGLVPPQADTQFDFRRLPVPPEKAHKMIILKGTIRDDGTPGDLQVYGGILPEMDEAARVAMSHWKFKPAMREGKAVAVQILVGIPVDGVPAQVTQSQ